MKAARAQRDADGRPTNPDATPRDVPPPPFDTLLLADIGDPLAQITALLPYYDINAPAVRVLGPVLWAAPAARGGSDLIGAWYAAPDPAARGAFDQAFQAKYGAPAPGLADFAYDAASIARVIAQSGGFSPQSLTTARWVCRRGRRPGSQPKWRGSGAAWRSSRSSAADRSWCSRRRTASPPPVSDIEAPANAPALLGAALAVATILAALVLALTIAWRRDSRLLEQAAGTVDRMKRQHAAALDQLGRRLAASDAIIDQLPDPVLVLGVGRSVSRANEAARAAFGADMPAVLRQPGLREAIDRAFDQRRPQEAELFLPVPVAREVQATVIMLDPATSDGNGAIAVLSDRTRERAVERMRADFVANASHELRTPLASLIGFIDTLRGPAADDPPAQQRFLGIMAEQAARMNRLIDDLLSLSRIELTEHLPPAGQVDMRVLIEPSAASLEPRFATPDDHAGLESPRRPARRAGRLRPAGAGVAEPAGERAEIRPEERVRAAVGSAAARLGAGPAARALFCGGDEGAGIPRTHIPRLTERFYRVDTGRSRDAGGTGLGLAIVKHIVNRHRGQLLIESEEGMGATFSIWLPIGVERAAL